MASGVRNLLWSLGVIVLCVPLAASGTRTGREPACAVELSLAVEARGVILFDPESYLVWRSERRDVLLSAGSSFDDLIMSLGGDVDGDNRLTERDLQVVRDAIGSRRSDAGYTPGADLDGDSEISVLDAIAWMDFLSRPRRIATVFVERTNSRAPDPRLGVTVGSPGGDGDNTAGGGGPLYASPLLTVSPTSGSLGTAITVTVSGGTLNHRFGPSSTAKWVGRYEPVVGQPTGNFQVNFSAAQLREFSLTQAILVLGDGEFVNAPDPDVLNGPGSLVGTLTVTFSGVYNGSKSLSFSLETDASVLEQVEYYGGFGGPVPPVIAGVSPDGLQMVVLSTTPDPLHPSLDTLLGSSDSHVAAVVRMAQNATTTANAPSTIAADLVSYDSGGTEIDRVAAILLTKLANDGDPQNIVYHNNLSVPIVLVDVALNKASYPQVILLRGVSGGSAIVVPN